jgi:hypothetical protein
VVGIVLGLALWLAARWCGAKKFTVRMSTTTLKPHYSNYFQQIVMYGGPLRTAIVMLLATVPWSASAQTATQKQNLDEYISNLRACAQAHAPEAQAAGVRTSDEAAKYFAKKCIPVLGLFLIGSDVDHQKRSADELKDMGAPPPGIFRAAFKEEWAVFIDRMDKR